MAQQIEGLAKFVATARYEDVPAAVRDHTKVVLLRLRRRSPTGRRAASNCATVCPVAPAPPSMRAAGPSKMLAPPRC